MGLRTPLYEKHEALGANWTLYNGWDMPGSYTSQIEEHHIVRKSAGIFDVCHMGAVDITGPDAKALLRDALANDVEKLKEPGKALYSCMLNEQGGVVDDLIVYFVNNEHYRIVWNAATKEKDFIWLSKLQKDRNFHAEVKNREDLGIIAIQGPEALSITKNAFPEWAERIDELHTFQAFFEEDYCVARTGYTGEDGLEITAKANAIANVWQKLIDNGAKPCGLGARDTLRLEAGLNLYSHDMTEETSPLISNLGWTIDWRDENRNFIGKPVLIKEKQEGVKEKLVGLVMDKGVLRDGQKVVAEGVGEGVITSGGYSPTLGCAIALARVPVATEDKACIERRGKLVPVDVVRACFVRHGKSVIK